MKRIAFMTDEWGPEGYTHFEISFGNRIVQMTITDEMIYLIGPPVLVEKTAVNAVTITPVDVQTYLDKSKEADNRVETTDATPS